MIHQKKLPKNIIICADGTGNKGGSSPDSNVYRVYNMINKHFKGTIDNNDEIGEQILFYDNGVGTAKNKFIRAVSAGIGLGFRHNVCDLYKFIARNYEEYDQEHDRIYFFGFSRGASTVRACNGMISKVGLVKSEGLGNSELDERVKEAYEKYRDHMRKGISIDDFRDNKKISWGAVPIQFLGVWDTVVALGFPKKTDVTGPITLLIRIIFGTLETISDYFFPHNFYHYKLTDNVNYACQALAIDDERTAFWPHVWQEKNIPDAEDRTVDNVNQVWFSGMHANVGGGYERDGMAGVPLYWVMKQAEEKGLIFNPDAMQLVLDRSHEHGRMYNTRLGLKMMYRYHPREIENLCKTSKGESILLDNIKIHNSVIERLRHRTANYIPGHIPESFDVVYSENSNKDHLNPANSMEWGEERNNISKLVKKRKTLYAIMATSIVIFFSATLSYWNFPEPAGERVSYLSAFADFLNYISPDMFNGLIQVVVVKKPIIMVVAAVAGLTYYCTRHGLLKKMSEASESLRRIIIDEVKNKNLKH